MILVLIFCALPTAAQTPKPKPKPPPRPAETVKKEPQGHLLIFTTAALAVSVDGEEVGSLPENGTQKISVTVGQHLVLAKDAAGDVVWRQVVEAKAGEQVVVNIEVDLTPPSRMKDNKDGTATDNHGNDVDYSG